MKLELKHLAGYLPYGLLVTKNDWTNYMLLTPCSSYLADSKRKYEIGILDVICFKAKPILHPLSDLTKKIDFKNKKITPLTELLRLSNFDVSKMIFENQLEFLDTFTNILFLSFEDGQRLMEWHFDIYGLIEKGLAIDINTLK